MLPSSWRLGATAVAENRCRFLVWAPRAGRVEVKLLGPQPRHVALEAGPRGYFAGELDECGPGSRYLLRLDGQRELPDPCSRFQPEGVHGPSQVVGDAYAWTDDDWRGLPLRDYIMYELHVGTFSPEGTFAGVAARLDHLVDLGVTAVELLPVAQFPGGRNWGYDGVYPFAVQNSYGGPDGLRALVDACHARRLAVVLDVVYNHLGPEGNYLGEFGPYFTERYRTPWGGAVNFDDQQADEVRRLFIENAVGWVRDYHVDALRLDAVHAIFDESARPFLWELNEAVQEEALRLNRRVQLIAESNKNDARHVQPPPLGGFGLAGQWSDDFHHALHTVLTGEHDGYYVDFQGVQPLGKVYRDGFTYTGQRSEFRARRHGVPCAHLPPERFVVFAQNHDQIGNRACGERLSALASFEQLKLAAGLVLLAPYLPLLFMGEEWGETAPFLYFVSHSDPDLVAAVRAGRQEEFESFQWRGEVPDPQAEETFHRSKLNWQQLDQPRHRTLLQWHRHLIQLRQGHPAFRRLSREHMEVELDEARRVLRVARGAAESQVCLLHCLQETPAEVSLVLPAGDWQTLADSASRQWQGPGSPVPASLGIEQQQPAQLTLAPWSVVVLASPTPSARFPD